MNDADVAASTRSPLTASEKPAPAAVPLTAVISTASIRANVDIARCRSSAMPLTNGPGPSGEAAIALRSPPAQKNRPAPVSTTTLVAGDVARRGRVGQFARHRVVHPVGGVGPVQGDAGDGAGLVELQGLDIGHAETLTRRDICHAVSGRPAAARRSRRRSPGCAMRPSAIIHGCSGWAGAVVGAAVDDGFDQPERQVVGIGGTAAFGDHLAGEHSVALAQLRAAAAGTARTGRPGARAADTARRGSSGCGTTGATSVTTSTCRRGAAGPLSAISSLGQLQRGVDGAGQQCVEDVVLGGEVVIQRGLPHADRVGDAPRRGAGVAVRGEQLRRGVEDLLAGGLARPPRLLEPRASTAFAAAWRAHCRTRPWWQPHRVGAHKYLSFDRNRVERFYTVLTDGDTRPEPGS